MPLIKNMKNHEVTVNIVKPSGEAEYTLTFNANSMRNVSDDEMSKSPDWSKLFRSGILEEVIVAPRTTVFSVAQRPTETKAPVPATIKKDTKSSKTTEVVVPETTDKTKSSKAETATVK